ncbi:MAG: hypothetical protein MUD04_12865 [Cyanobium sp. Prado107]|nr:hypothetical protein [Cyanobium sp. Prado107]
MRVYQFHHIRWCAVLESDPAPEEARHGAPVRNIPIALPSPVLTPALLPDRACQH